MAQSDSTHLTIDLNHFKLHLNLPDQKPLSLHFDTPSRRFYLSVIALVLEEMGRKGGMGSVPLEEHAEVLALLNETVGEGAGSSKKKSLLPRIYNKWKSALPDLENAPLFKVIGVKKGYDEASGKVYRFDEKSKDAWANLFEYKGSRDKVRLRFSVEKLGIGPKDVVIFYGNETEAGPSSAWERFLNSLSPWAGETGTKAGTQESLPLDESASQPRDLARGPSIGGFAPGWTDLDGLKASIEGREGIEKIPLKTRLEWIARLAMAPSSEEHGADTDKTQPDALTDALKEGPAPNRGQGISPQISSILLQGIFKAHVAGMPYRAPELAAGQAPSSRSDVYALGVLLYQVVVGDLSRPLDSNWPEAVKDDILREDIALAVAEDPQKRLANPAILAERLLNLNKRHRLVPAQISQETQERDAHHRQQRVRRALFYGSLFATILILITGFLWHQDRVARVEAARKSAYETDLPRIRGLLDAEKYVEAHALARATEKIIPDDPTLAQYMQDATNTIGIDTVPQGAKVSYRAYKDFDGPWIELGITPVSEAVVPVGMHRWRIQKEGFEEREVVRAVLPRDAWSPELKATIDPFYGDRYRFSLYEKGAIPDGMVAVDRGHFIVPIPGLPAQKTQLLLDYFFIDKTEVTNQAYKEFVDAGGYADPKYWKEEFRKDGRSIAWPEAIKTFVDRTDKPGPCTWELGDYPDGQEDYPVSGVSWYEAAAYARFRGKCLPTIYHWARATFPLHEISTSLTPHIVRQSNIEGTGPVQAGSYPGIGSSGAKDMAGNVREWCWNAVGEKRYCQGGMWQDATYMFNNCVTPSAWDRSAGNGFRCTVYPEDAPVSDELLADMDVGIYDPYTIPPYSREAFEAMKAMFAYEPTPLRSVIEARKEGGRGWRRETVTIDAAYNQERLIIHLDLPTEYPPPYKAVIYFPGGNALYQPQFARNDLWEPWDAIPKSGRALISPVYSGTFERGGSSPGRLAKKSPVQWFSEIVNDLRRTVDYLETRNDLDTEDLAFLGVCWGGAKGPVYTAYEDRIKTLILVSGCIRLPVSEPKPEGLVQPLLTLPVLMLNGKYDYVFPLNTHQKPLFDLLGTRPEHKKHVIYETGHLPLPRGPMLKEIFAWLDKYQGPVAYNGRSMAKNVVEKGDSQEVPFRSNRR